MLVECFHEAGVPAECVRLLIGGPDEGKALVVIAGPNLARLAEVPELHALLPVELTRDSSRPFWGTMGS